ncbi:hypothetical protein AB1L30_09845 [Bremerella sp. JC817]|uniref:hypothetical protein n=1 Tax=Bremerella sp. JC817 TaxID=3231756 RepID=UPI0034588E6C
MLSRSRIFSCELLETRRVLSATSIVADQLVNDPTIGNQVGSEGDSAAYLESGELVAVYSGRGLGDSDGIYFRRIDSDGEVVGSPQLVNQTVAGEQTNASVAQLPSGGFLVVWEGRGAGDRAGIFARWYDAAGTAITGEVLINQTTGGSQQNAQVAVAEDGTATFVWDGVGSGDFDGVFLRQFTSSGQAVAGELLVNTATIYQQAYADVAINDSGQIMVTWSSRHQDGSDWGIYGQAFTAAGVKSGTEFLVNTETELSQSNASLVAVGDDFVVAWQSRSQGGNDWDLFGQRIDSSGAAIGGEFQINAASAGNQHEVKLAATSSGSVVVAWTDGIEDGTGWNVKAREIDLSETTPVLADEFFVNESTANGAFGHQRASSIAATDEAFAIAFSGDGAVDHDGMYLACYVGDFEPNLSPDMEPIPDQTAQVGVELVIQITATDPNGGDTLTYILDAEDSPAGATIEKIDNNHAVIRWTPTADDLPGPVSFRVLVIDDGEPPLADDEAFVVTLTAASS